MDNATMHAGVKELIGGAGAKLIHLSAYSPELNPIELMFGTCLSLLLWLWLSSFIVVIIILIVAVIVVVISSLLFNNNRYVQGIFETPPRGRIINGT